MADKDNYDSERIVSRQNNRREDRADKLEDTVHNLVDVMTRFVTAINTTHNLQYVHQAAEDENWVAGNQAIANDEGDEVARPRNRQRRENPDRPRRRLLRTGGSRDNVHRRTERVSVFSRLGTNTNDDADSTWAPSRANIQNTTDLRDHLNRRRGGVHARLGPNPVRSQASGTNGQGNHASRGTHLNRQNDQTTHGGQASAINQGNNLDEVVRRAVNRINDLCDERGLPRQGLNVTDDASPPFTEEILNEEFPEDFKMPQIKAYDGKTDPLDHIETYRTWMNVRRASASLKCQAFPLTLTGAARQWYRSLKPGTIGSFEQLKGEFLSRFIGSKTRKKDKTHLWSLKQGKDESLKKYIDRFSEGMNLIDEFTDSDVLSALREGLQEGELLTSIIRRAPKTFGEFLARAQEFVNVEEYLQSRKSHKGEGKRKSESEAKESDSKKTKVENKTAKDNKKPLIAPRFQTFTPLNATPEQILMQIENRNILTRPEPMRMDPDKRDRTKYCRFHNDHGHMTSECIHLKRQIEALIQ